MSNKQILPTYYVAHPDGSFSVADPQLEQDISNSVAYAQSTQSLKFGYSTPEPQAQAGEPDLPPAYMLAKLQMVMPLFQEARDALTAITEAQRKLHAISPTLADRMDEAGTFSLDDWSAAITQAREALK